MTPRKPEAPRTMKYWAFLVRTPVERRWRFIKQKGKIEAEKALCHRADVLEILQCVEINAEQYANGLANSVPEKRCQDRGVGTVIRRNQNSAPRSV